MRPRRNELQVAIYGALFAVAVFVLPLYIYTFYRTGNAVSSLRQITGRPVLVAFGDSITQRGYYADCSAPDGKCFSTAGWVGLLSGWMSRKADVYNRGFSGYNTRWGLDVIDDVVVKMSPDFVVIFFGANDAIDVRVPQHVPLEEYQENIGKMVQNLKNLNKDIDILLITPPPIWEPALEENNRMKKKQVISDRSNERTKLYADIVVDIAHKFGLHHINLWREMEGEFDSRQDYLIDGLHLNDRGNVKLFELIQSVIETDFPYWNPENMPWHKKPSYLMVTDSLNMRADFTDVAIK